jgi:hypothetical protein
LNSEESFEGFVEILQELSLGEETVNEFIQGVQHFKFL